MIRLAVLLSNISEQFFDFGVFHVADLDTKEVALLEVDLAVSGVPLHEVGVLDPEFEGLVEDGLLVFAGVVPQLDVGELEGAVLEQVTYLA